MSKAEELINNINKVIVGKNDVVELVVTSLITGGHVLIEDMPGTGKTMLCKALAKSVDADFGRVQFTPDLLPSDLTGINFYNQKSMEFEFREGPLFSNIIVADEINRATPRTQSSLLEAMEEKQITVDKLTRKLDSPFMVLATQNPVESYGTYPLPEAQLDRFLMRVDMGYPTFEEEAEVVRRSDNKNISEELETVVSKEDIEYVQEHYTEVTMNDTVVNYLLNIVNETRNKDNILLGISPRGTIALYKASKAYAAVNGRDFVIPEDVKHMAPFVLNHRVKFRGSKRKGIYDNINELLDKVPVPTEEI